MHIHSRDHNRNHSRVVVAQGALALLTFTLMLAVAARGIQSQPDVQAQQSAVSMATQANTQPEARDGQPGNAEAGVYTGTIVKDGEVLVFRDQSGKVYRLSAPSKAKPYEGKPVKVKGTLDKATGLLHADSIEALPA